MNNLAVLLFCCYCYVRGGEAVLLEISALDSNVKTDCKADYSFPRLTSLRLSLVMWLSGCLLLIITHGWDWKELAIACGHGLAENMSLLLA